MMNYRSEDVEHRLWLKCQAAERPGIGRLANAFRSRPARSPRSNRNNPARAIIAALSVASLGDGANTVAPISAVRSRIALTSAELHATPPPSTIRERPNASAARYVF